MNNRRTSSITKDDGKKKNKKKRAAAKNKKSSSTKSSSAVTTEPSLALSIGIAIIFLLSPPICLYTCRLFSNPTFLTTSIQYIPNPISNTLQYMFPIHELNAAYNIITSFVTNKDILHDMIVHLLFVTLHIQMGLGHIGIAFLTSEQRRKNMLIRMDVDDDGDNDRNQRGDGDDDNNEQQMNGGVSRTSIDIAKKSNIKKQKSQTFRRSAPTFILCTVLPYMFQIILFGNLNKYAFVQVQNQIHRSVRIQELFDHDSHLSALAADGATSPEVYAASMDTVVGTGKCCLELFVVVVWAMMIRVMLFSFSAHVPISYQYPCLHSKTKQIIE